MPNASASDDEFWDEPSLGELVAERRGERELKAFGRHSVRDADSSDGEDDESNDTGDDSSSEEFEGEKIPQLSPLQPGHGKEKDREDKKTVKPKRATSKSRPREMPSNRPVPVGRDACLGISSSRGGTGGGSARSVRRFDPRFEEHCGELREMHVERNYSFLADQREERRSELEEMARRRDKQRKKKGKKKGGNNDNDHKYEADDVDKELDRMRQDDLRRESVLRKRNVLKQVIDEQKEAVRQGKKPVFLNRRELRERELREQFDQLKKRKGGVSKFIAKRRRKLTSKERKRMHAGSGESG